MKILLRAKKIQGEKYIMTKLVQKKYEKVGKIYMKKNSIMVCEKQGKCRQQNYYLCVGKNRENVDDRISTYG